MLPAMMTEWKINVNVNMLVRTAKALKLSRLSMSMPMSTISRLYAASDLVMKLISTKYDKDGERGREMAKRKKTQGKRARVIPISGWELLEWEVATGP